jgi:asparagine synthase (glutamine-hydrolysing)
MRAALPAAFDGWSPLERAGYLEQMTLLEPYLLAAQGDRVAMAHGVEGRFPFLDHRVFEAAASLTPSRKLDGMRDKVALREMASGLLPREVVSRAKQPYRAPEVAPFLTGTPPAWVAEHLSDGALRATGIFDEGRVAAVLRRCRARRAPSYRDGMALVGVLSTQVWHQQFFRGSSYEEERAEPRVDLRFDLERARDKEVAT